MQPTYLPWIGYFDLMDSSDIFVLLDSVQFDKRSWQQRNKIKSLNGELLLTVPVKTKSKFYQRIYEVEIDYEKYFPNKHIKSVYNAYSKSLFFNEYYFFYKSILNKKHVLLSDLNIYLIKWLKEEIGINTEIYRSSKINIYGKKTDLLISICKYFNEKDYLSPIGSEKYINENNIFYENGINLIYQNYDHPIYKQMFGHFISYLSVLDLLFNEGKRSLEIIRKGRKY